METLSNQQIDLIEQSSDNSDDHASKEQHCLTERRIYTNSKRGKSIKEKIKHQ
jgi:hypothetical protein